MSRATPVGKRSAQAPAGAVDAVPAGILSAGAGALPPPRQQPACLGLTYSHIGMYILRVPRAATTSDIFNAVAEPRRREILTCLAPREQSVGEIAAALRLAQPSVSKHLKVLRDVNLVQVRRVGRTRYYRTHALALRPVRDWAAAFERLWRHQLDRVKETAEAKERRQPSSP